MSTRPNDIATLNIIGWTVISVLTFLIINLI
ncbi:hypothetical protein PcP3B5_46330 [Pseudomonas citronellolis]|nr:hypothetical protein PcP3B5_46330 [Pseudomonas citronellolis]